MKRYFGNDMNEVIRRQRKYASYWDWPDKDVKEIGVVRDLLEAMCKRGDERYGQPNGVDDQWPDCIVKDASDRNIAVEVTELVDEEAVRICQKGERVYRRWRDEEVIDKLTAIMARKDKKANHGGLYAKVMLVIYTNEFELTSPRLMPILENRVFPGLTNIEEVYVICSYEPGPKTYPYTQLRFSN
jgi:hypothetical protein